MARRHYLKIQQARFSTQVASSCTLVYTYSHFTPVTRSALKYHTLGHPPAPLEQSS